MPSVKEFIRGAGNRAEEAKKKQSTGGRPTVEQFMAEGQQSAAPSARSISQLGAAMFTPQQDTNAAMNGVIGQLNKNGWNDWNRDSQYRRELGLQMISAQRGMKDYDPNTADFDAWWQHQQQEHYLEQMRQMEGIFQQRQQARDAFGSKVNYDAYMGLGTSWEDAQRRGLTRKQWADEIEGGYQQAYARINSLTEAERAFEDYEKEAQQRIDYYRNELAAHPDSPDAAWMREQLAANEQELEQRRQELELKRQEMSGAYDDFRRYGFQRQFSSALEYDDLKENEDWESGVAAGRAAADPFIAAQVAEAEERDVGDPNEKIHTDVYHDVGRLPENTWTEEERDIFYYLYNRDQEEAFRYAEKTNDRYDLQNYYKTFSEAQQWSYDHPVLGDLLGLGSRVATIPLGIYNWLRDAGQYARTGRIRHHSYADPRDLANAWTAGAAERLNELGTLPEDWAVIGGKGLGDAYQLGASILESAAYGGLSKRLLAAGAPKWLPSLITNVGFFGTAGSEATQQALERGAPSGQALLLGSSAGFAEGLFETISIENRIHLSRPGTWRAAVVNTLKQGGVEASEEFNTTIANRLFDNWIMGGESEFNRQVQQNILNGMSQREAEEAAWHDWADGLLYDALGGFLSGGISGGFNQAGQVISGSRTEYSGTDRQALLDAALQMDPNGKAYQLAQKIQQNGTMSVSEATRLIELMGDTGTRVTDQQTEQDRAGWQQRAETALRASGVENPGAAAQLIAKQVMGEELTRDERRVLKGVQQAEQVSTALQEARRQEEGFLNYRAQLMRQDVKKQNAARKKGADTRTTTVKGEKGAVKIEELTVENGRTMAKVTGTDGKSRTVAFSSLELDDYQRRALNTFQQVLGRDAIAAYNSLGSENIYSMSAYDIMQQAIAWGNIRNMFGAKTTDAAKSLQAALASPLRGKLSDAQVEQAFEIGRKHAQEEKTERPKSKRGTGHVSLDGGTVDGVELKGIQNKDQVMRSKEYRAVKAIAKALGIDVVLFESEAVNESGDLSGIQGAYQDGVIYLDWNAGMKNLKQVGSRMLLRTMSHELTHFIQQNAPELYEELKDYVTGYLADKMGADFNDLVAQKMAGRNVDRDGAIDEVVADACETMLRDSQAVKDLVQNHRSLWQSIKDFVLKYLGNITPEDTGAIYMQDAIQELQEIWGRGLKAAVENRTDVETESETAAENEKTATTLQAGPVAAVSEANAAGAAQMSLRPVAPVQPSSNAWSRTHDTAEAMKAFSNLWNVAAEESEKRNPTQIASTQGTYRNIYKILQKEGFTGKILDASSGLGLGTKVGREEFGFDVDDIEPYPDASYKPKYTDYSKLHKKYDAIISSAVLNVLPQDQRDALVVKMGELLNPGGRMFITTRGKDVDSLAKTGKNIHLGNMEWIETVKGSYQKGFTQNELKAYLEDALGPDFTVELSNAKNGGKFNNNTSIVVTKKAATTGGMVQFAIRPEAKKEIHDVINGKAMRESVVLTDGSPSIMLGHNGVKNLPLAMSPTHARENILSEAEAKAKGFPTGGNHHYHGLGEPLFYQIIDGLNDVAEAYRGTKNASDASRRENYFLLVSKYKDASNNFVNVPVYINTKSQYNQMFIDTNTVATVFGRDNFRDYISRQLRSGDLVRIKRKGTTASERTGLIPDGYSGDTSGKNVPHSSEKSNTPGQLSVRNQQRNQWASGQYAEEYEQLTSGKSLDQLFDGWQQRGRELQAVQAELRQRKTAYNERLDEVINGTGAIEGRVAAFNQWQDESGYSALQERENLLDRQSRMLRDAYYEANDAKLEADEKEAIRKSGLSEEEYFAKLAVKEFGYTPYFYDAGYIMPNGKMLNFSGEKGRHFGSRGQDHRAISTIFATTENTEAMNRFINQGNIRIMAESPGLDISTGHEPTAEQYRQIRAFARASAEEEYFNVDFTDERGNVTGNLEYEGTIRPDRVVNDIKHYFQTGEIREQGLGAFYSVRSDAKTDRELLAGVTAQTVMSERLQQENEILRESVRDLRKLLGQRDGALDKLRRQLRLTKSPELRLNDAKRMTRSLLQDYDSRADAARIAQEVKELGEFILGTELTGEAYDQELDRRLGSIARQVVENAKAEFTEGTDVYKEIASRIKGKKISVDAGNLGDLGDFGAFRKSLFGKLIVSQRAANTRESRADYTSADQMYAELQADYGETIFPTALNEGEELQNIARALELAKPTEANPFAQDMQAAEESVRNRVLMDLYSGALELEAPTAADRAKSRRKALQDQIKQLHRENRLSEKESQRMAEQIYALDTALDKARSQYETLLRENTERRNELEKYRKQLDRYEQKEREVSQALNELDALVKEGTDADAVNKQRARLSDKERQMTEALQAVTNAQQSPALQQILQRERAIERTRTRERIREGVNRRDLRGKINRLWKDLNQRITNPTEKNHIPVEVMQQAIEVLQALNMDTSREGTASGERLRSKLLELRQRYDALKNDKDYQMASRYDEYVNEMLGRMVELVGDTPINKMSFAQMEAVYDTLKALDHVIRNKTKIQLGERMAEVKAVGQEAINETRSIDKARKGWLQKYFNRQLSPERMFNRLGGYHKNSVWSQLYRMLNGGQLRQTQLEMEGSLIFDDLINSKEYSKQYKDFVDPGKTVDVGLKDKSGNAVKLTHGMMVSLWMHLQNEQNRRHVAYGGLTIPGLKDYYGGKRAAAAENGVCVGGVLQQIEDLNKQIDETDDPNKILELEEKRDTISEDFTQKLLDAIEKNLTEYDRQWIAACREMFDGFSKRVLNETTMQVYGIKRANVENYFPLSVDKHYLQANFDTIVRDFNLENAGFMKERVESKKPVHLFDVSDVAAQQVRRVSQYAGMMPAIRAFNQVLGFTSQSMDSVQSAIFDKFGNSGMEYIENLMADLNGARRQKDTGLGEFLNRMRGHMAQASLTLSLRTAMAQTASFPTAATVVGWKALHKALWHGGRNGWLFSRADRALIQKYSPLLYYRMKGYSSVALGDIAGMNDKWSRVWKKARWLTGWIQAMDGATVGRLWYAAEYYVQDHNKDLQKGTDAYYEAVAAVFNDIVEKTQPNYSTMQRPDILRDPNALVRQLTMFMTQRLQNLNIVFDAAATYSTMKADYKAKRNGVTLEDVRQAGIQTRRAVVSQVVAAMTIVAFKTLADIVQHSMNAYRDDDKELTAESISLELLDMFIDCLAGNVLGGGEVWDVAEKLIPAFNKSYYGIEVSGIGAVNDFMDAMLSLYSKATNENSKPDWKDYDKVIKNFCTLAGIPWSNGEKFVKAGWYWIQDAREGELFSFEAGVDRTTAMQAHRLYRAYQDKDFGKANKIRAQFPEDKQKDLDEAVRKYIKEQYKAGDITVYEAMRQLQSYGNASTDMMRNFIQEQYADGNLPKGDAIKYLQEYCGKDQAGAEETVRNWTAKRDTGTSYDDIHETFAAGGLTADEARDMLVNYGGMSRDEAQDRVDYWAYKDRGGVLSEKRFKTFRNDVAPTGVSLDYYDRALQEINADGNSSYSQAEAGPYLKAEEAAGHLTHAQAAAIWDAITTGKASYDDWLAKNK